MTRDVGIDLLATSAERPARAAGPAGANPHIWLDPANAVRIVDHLAAVLGEIDPANAARYRSNRVATIARLTTLDRSLERSLADELHDTRMVVAMTIRATIEPAAADWPTAGSALSFASADVRRMAQFSARASLL